MSCCACCCFSRKKKASVSARDLSSVPHLQQRGMCKFCRKNRRPQSCLKGKGVTIPSSQTVIAYYEAALRKKKCSRCPAIVFENHSHTFEEIETVSSRVARVLWPELQNLMTSNKKEDIIIGFCLFPSHKTVILILAILKLGAAYISFDVGTSSEMLVRHVGSTRPISIIIEDDEDIASRFESVSKVTKLLTINIIDSWMEERQGLHPNVSQTQVNQLESSNPVSERIAAVVFTSGHSSYPRSIINSLEWYSSTFPFKSKEVCSLTDPTASVNSITDIFCPLTNGTCVVILPRDHALNLNKLVESIENYKITRITLQPVNVSQLLTHLDESTSVEKVSSLKYLFCTHDILPIQLAKKFFEILEFANATVGQKGEIATTSRTTCKLVVTYGTSEVTGNATYQIFKTSADLDEDAEMNKASIGYPIWNTLVYLTDNQQQVVDLCTRGEICIAGLPVSAGFYGGDMDMTEKFINNPFTSVEDYEVLYRTGDFGRMIPGVDNKPRLFYDKRHESEVSIHGKVYDLDKIASIILSMNLVQDCYVLCFMPDEIEQRIIAACVMPSEEVTAFKISSKLFKSMNRQCIAEVFPIEKLPFQPNGKIDKQHILKEYKNYRKDLGKWNLLRLPPSKLDAAKEILPTIASVLSVSVNHLIDYFHCSFYQLGGDSLNTLSTVYHLCQRGYYISIQDFIKAPTLKAIFEKAMSGYEKMQTAKVKFLIWQYNSGEDLADLSQALELLKIQHEKEKICKSWSHSKLCYLLNKLVSSAYGRKSLLFLCGNVSANDFMFYLKSNWDSYLTSRASVVAFDKSKNIVAALLCQEYLPKYRKLKGLQQMRYIIELQRFCVTRALKQIGPERDKILLVQFFASDSELSASENVLMLIAMIKEAMEQAKNQGYDVALIASEHPTVAVSELLHIKHSY